MATDNPESVVGFDEHHGPGVRAYLVVFAALSIFTLVSFLANYFARHEYITHVESFIIILGVAIVKAGLVVAYFMHMIVDWRKLYYLVIPAFILGAMWGITLMPDIVLAWH